MAQFDYTMFNSSSTAGSVASYLSYSNIFTHHSILQVNDTFTFTYTNGSPTLTLGVATYNTWRLADGDQMTFPNSKPGINAFNIGQVYHVVQSSTTDIPQDIGTWTFKLSATQGGTPIVLDSTGNYFDQFGIKQVNSSAPRISDYEKSYGVLTGNFSFTYLDIGVAAANMMKAAGVSWHWTAYINTFTPYQGGTTYNLKQNGEFGWKMQNRFGP